FRRVALAARDSHRRRPFPKRRLVIRTLLSRTHVAHEKLENHFARFDSARGLRLHVHVRGRLTYARRREHSLAFHLDHAGAAIAIRAVSRQVDVTKMSGFEPLALGHVPDRFAGRRRYWFPVEDETDSLGHVRDPHGTA